MIQMSDKKQNSIRDLEDIVSTKDILESELRKIPKDNPYYTVAQMYIKTTNELLIDNYMTKAVLKTAYDLFDMLNDEIADAQYNVDMKVETALYCEKRRKEEAIKKFSNYLCC